VDRPIPANIAMLPELTKAAAVLNRRTTAAIAFLYFRLWLVVTP
jgi:hypothetical protein